LVLAAALYVLPRRCTRLRCPSVRSCSGISARPSVGRSTVRDHIGHHGHAALWDGYRPGPDAVLDDGVAGASRRRAHGHSAPDIQIVEAGCDAGHDLRGSLSVVIHP